MSFVHEDAAPSITFVVSLELNVMFFISSFATSEFNFFLCYSDQEDVDSIFCICLDMPLKSSFVFCLLSLKKSE